MLTDKGSDVLNLTVVWFSPVSDFVDLGYQTPLGLGSNWSDLELARGICSFLATEPQTGPSTTEDPCGYAGNRLFWHPVLVMLLRIEILLPPTIHLILPLSSICNSSEKTWWQFWVMGGSCEVDNSDFFFPLWNYSGISCYHFVAHCCFWKSLGEMFFWHSTF